MGVLGKSYGTAKKEVAIGPKKVDCIFVGYAHNSSSAYRFLLQKSEISDTHVNTFMELRSAFFFENIFPCKEKKVQNELDKKEAMTKNHKMR